MTLLKQADAFALPVLQDHFLSVRELVHNILESIRWEAVEPDQIFLVVQIPDPVLCVPRNEDDSALRHFLLNLVDLHQAFALQDEV